MEIGEIVFVIVGVILGLCLALIFVGAVWYLSSISSIYDSGKGKNIVHFGDGKDFRLVAEGIEFNEAQKKAEKLRKHTNKEIRVIYGNKMKYDIFEFVGETSPSNMVFTNVIDEGWKG